MGVIFMDGFDVGDFAMKWNVADATSSSTTRFNVGKSVGFSGAGALKKYIPATSAVYVGFAAYASSSPLAVQASYPALVSLYSDSGATTHLSLRPNTTTSMGLFLGSSTLLGSFTFPTLTWRYVEIYATIHDTTGAYTVKVDGITVLSATNVDTRNGGTSVDIDAVQISRADNSSFIIDDFYISDSNFMGEIRIQTLVPSAAGSSTQLTATGGANYANVADIPDSTATYNASTTIGNKDLYTLSDLVASTATVKVIQVNTHIRKDDAGDAFIKAKVKSGSTEVSGATVALSASTAWHGDLWETDPNTSAAWTVSAVNALEAGAEVA